MSKNRPFENILIVDFTHVLAGPACAYYFGLLGARIIKVESEQRGDGIRYRGGTDKQAAAPRRGPGRVAEAQGRV